MLSISIHEHNRESHRLPTFLVLQMNCPDSLSRNKAKNALSLTKTISPVLAGQKYELFGWWKKKCRKEAKKCNFAWSKRFNSAP